MCSFFFFFFFLYFCLFFFFFFSSRRRHTRSLCDWSSDVCSSDLANQFLKGAQRRDSATDGSACHGFFDGVPQRRSVGPRGFAQRVDGRFANAARRSEEHTSELQSHSDLVCRLLLEKKKKK